LIHCIFCNILRTISVSLCDCE